jgi:hypothetical protein
MKTIKLTSIQDGGAIRLNPDHIVAYWNSDTYPGSEIKVSIGPIDQGLIVKETAEQIDELLSEVV